MTESTIHTLARTMPPTEGINAYLVQALRESKANLRQALIDGRDAETITSRSVRVSVLEEVLAATRAICRLANG